TIITFIGDGYSDFCAAEHSDIIFAKKSLAANCNKNKLPHYPYSNFFDVSRIFRDIIPKGKIKARNQARQLRNRAFLNE
ncbi:MAG: 2-hydroxy-3-keto-5-methylthiopentenyl-phosphate phosphatase, partial [Bacteroidota bacterium]|nr:2-hydroxy-3-keto-5-methylthiopentenyl-phosphate phosphatase [Bacteroidota bacterium]